MWSGAGLKEARAAGGQGCDEAKAFEKNTKKVFDSFQNQIKNFSQKTGKFPIPIKYRNCYFFSVSWKSYQGVSGGCQSGSFRSDPVTNHRVRWKAKKLGEYDTQGSRVITDLSTN